MAGDYALYDGNGDNVAASVVNLLTWPRENILDQLVGFALGWGSYAAWLGLLAWLAWRGKSRLLLISGAPMLLMFAWLYMHVTNEMAAPDYGHSGDMAAGALILLGAAVLIVPLGVAALAYPIGRLWAR